MARTFRCFCGHSNPLPKNQAEAMRPCPGCGRSLLYLYDPQQNEERIIAEIKEARRHRLFPNAFSFALLTWLAIGTGFVWRRPESLHVIGADADWGWRPMAGWGLSVFGLSLVASISTSGFYLLFTGKEYVEDRVSFTRAGCYELASAAPLVGVLLAYAAYQVTWTKFSPDPMASIRSPNACIGVFTASAFLCVIVGAWLLFRVRQSWRS
jgi:hypothetical protein